MSQDGQLLSHRPAAITMAGRIPLARGRWFPAHVHGDHQLAWAAQGVVSVRVENRTWVLPGGLALWIPAGIRHATGAVREADLVGVYLPVAACPIDWTRPTMVAIGPLARELLIYLGGTVDDRMRRHAESVLLGVLEPVPDIQVDLPMPSDRRVAPVAAALVRRPTDPRVLDEWATTVGISSRTLARVWRSNTGLTFAQWRTRCRVRAALPLLAEGTAVSTVARRVGYETSSAFVAAFRREIGRSPGRAFA